MSSEKRQTINLTGRPPVTFNPDRWPIVARGSWHNSRNGIERDATRTAEIRIRQHADGRAIVYGWTNSRWQDEESTHAGELVRSDGSRLSALRRVAETAGVPDAAVQDCLNDLTPEDLDA